MERRVVKAHHVVDLSPAMLADPRRETDDVVRHAANARRRTHPRVLHYYTASSSPPGCATSCLRPANQLHAVFRTSPELNFVDKANNNWLPRQRPPMDRNTNFGSFIYSHSFTNPANFTKIGPADFEIIGLKGIVKK